MAFRGGISRYDAEKDQIPGRSKRITNDMIVDYGSASSPLKRFLLLAVGITAIITLIMLVGLIFPFLDSLMLIFILTGSTFILIYTEKKRTTIESQPDSFIIHRPIFRPVIIPKDEISTTEIRDNKQPLPYWLMTAIALVVMPIIIISGVYDRLCSWISGDITTSSFAIYLGYAIIFTLFILSIYYYSRTRYRYPIVFVIKTIKNQILAIYGKSFEELVEIKENLL